MDAVEYPVGSVVRVSTAVTDLNGAASDATEVTLHVQDPSGAKTQYTLTGSQVAHDGLGAYHYDLTLTKENRWTCRFEASGNLIAVSQDQVILATPSVFA